MNSKTKVATGFVVKLTIHRVFDLVSVSYNRNRLVDFDRRIGLLQVCFKIDRLARNEAVALDRELGGFAAGADVVGS